MIKSFKNIINEDYFSKLANRKDNGNVRMENEITEDFVRGYVRKGCEKYIHAIKIRKKDGKSVVDITGDFFLDTDVKEIPFQFGEVTGIFDCTSCGKLTSLKGCPTKVYKNFICMGCDCLTTLEGAPNTVAGYVSCLYCTNLVNLEGMPKTIGGFFECSHCGNLETLKGAENSTIFGGFTCNGCGKLYTLEFIPKVLSLSCKNCGKQFTKDYVKSLLPNIKDINITV